MLSVEDWAEIRRLHRSERMPIKAIAHALGISKNTVKAALASDGPPRYQRARTGSVVDGVEPRVRALLQAYPTMPATVIAERIGWTRGMTVLTERVRELRPVYLPPDPSSRTAYVAGEIAQHDFWFPDIELPVGCGQVRTARQLPVLTMATGYSRMLFARLIPTRTAEDLYCGWWRHLGGLGAVPRVLVWDGEGAVGEYGGGRNRLTAAGHAFRGTLGAKVLILRPRDPEAKGIIERAHDYLETSFLPGRAFTGPDDFNAQLQDWLDTVNRRTRRTLGCAPVDRIVADRSAMLPLPPVAPTTGWRGSGRLPRDFYVRLDGDDYSVHPAMIGRRIEVVADLERVRVLRRRGGGRPRPAVGQASDHHRPGAQRGGQAAAPRTHRPGPSRARTRGRGALPGRLRRRPRPRRRQRGCVMAATTKTIARDTAAELAFLTRALKAPTLRAAVPRLADRAGAENWTHEQFLLACAQREVAARESHGGEGRIRAARFPARKSLEEFDFDHARGLKRDTIAHLGTLDFVTARDNVVFLGPPGTGKTHLATGLAIRACQAGHRVLFATANQWVDRLAAAHHAGRLHDELTRLRRIPLIVCDEVGYLRLVYCLAGAEGLEA
jgi:DNA replication protein DnaC/transposase